ncbi:MAG TPA: response regulator [Polyangiales bacterium]|nr:response regulator [Polyangiales bacterium]
MTERVLIIDDDERLSEMLAGYLEARGFRCERRADARSGLEALAQLEVDAVVLDVMLPDIDGFEVCRQIRASSADVAIVMLTGRGEETDRIVGLELGADDYLPKPFNPRELLARLRAVLRRRRPPGAASQDHNLLRFGPLEIDRARREVRLRGELRALTSHQFAILEVLALRKGRVQSREQLMQAVRGQELEAFDRSIDVHVSRIRAAIEDDAERPRRIKTVRAAGYVFTADEDQS